MRAKKPKVNRAGREQALDIEEWIMEHLHLVHPYREWCGCYCGLKLKTSIMPSTFVLPVRATGCLLYCEGFRPHAVHSECPTPPSGQKGSPGGPGGFCFFSGTGSFTPSTAAVKIPLRARSRVRPVHVLPPPAGGALGPRSIFAA